MLQYRVRRCGIVLLAATTALAGLSTTNCGRHGGTSALEQQVATAVGHAIGVAAIGARCDGAAPTKCRVATAGSRGIDVVVKRGSDGNAQWSVDGTLVATAPVVAYLEGELEGLSVTSRANCGAALRVIPRGERMLCLIAAPGTLQAIPIAIAWVTTSASGPIDVEIAYGMTALAARWNDADDAALTALSAHLADVNDDIDDPAGVESTDGDGTSP